MQNANTLENFMSTYYYWGLQESSPHSSTGFVHSSTTVALTLWPPLKMLIRTKCAQLLLATPSRIIRPVHLHSPLPNLRIDNSTGAKHVKRERKKERERERECVCVYPTRQSLLTSQAIWKLPTRMKALIFLLVGSAATTLVLGQVCLMLDVVQHSRLTTSYQIIPTHSAQKFLSAT